MGGPSRSACKSHAQVRHHALQKLDALSNNNNNNNNNDNNNNYYYNNNSSSIKGSLAFCMRRGAARQGEKPLRPVFALRFWISGGLTQAQSQC